MIKNPNKIEWPECPKCKVVLNGYQYFSAQVLTLGLDTCKCPKCDEVFWVGMEYTVKLNVEKLEE